MNVANHFHWRRLFGAPCKKGLYEVLFNLRENTLLPHRWPQLETIFFKPRPSRTLLKRLKHVPKRDQSISTITICEMVYGAMKSDRSEYHLRNLETLLLPSVYIVGFDTKAAYLCGQLRADLEKKGQSLSPSDLEIAAIAIAGDFTLVTGNTRPFQRIHELRVENWLVSAD